ncbi:MAG: hybrid sensor histidine kinase/response regulator [Chloroflexi bacterium]|nr:hybrid sensor histidine kinase/response regulator [Chloroflexota bacterium]
MTRILVVEDAHTLRKDIVEMLQFEGFEVDSAENGQEALDIVRTRQPDLIISDIMMPVMDGMRLLEILRGDINTATIPLIFLTARSDRLDMRQGMELGADDFVTKPFHVGELLATVKAQLKKRAVRDKEAEKRMEDLRGNIIVALPHELRTPLNAVLGFSELLITDAGDMPSERVREMARHIYNAGQRIFSLVDSYLLYAHLELTMTDARRVAEARADVTIHPETIIGHSAHAMAGRHKRVDQLQLTMEPVFGVCIAEVYLKKLVDELIDNAFKFSPSDALVRIETKVDGGLYNIRISDNGQGLTPDQVANVGAYMQFSRRIQEQQGTGLGLVIAERICGLHEGKFQIESSPGAGTTVTVGLPIRASDG